jgi:hypothetical protein
VVGTDAAILAGVDVRGGSISVRRHIVPTLGSRPLNTLRRGDVERWAGSLHLAPSTVATLRQHLGQLLGEAVDDGLISRNPATGACLPEVDSVKPQPVPAAVVEAIRASPRTVEGS